MLTGWRRREVAPPVRWLPEANAIAWRPDGGRLWLVPIKAYWVEPESTLQLQIDAAWRYRQEEPGREALAETRARVVADLRALGLREQLDGNGEVASCLGDAVALLEHHWATK